MPKFIKVHKTWTHFSGTKTEWFGYINVDQIQYFEKNNQNDQVTGSRIWLQDTNLAVNETVEELERLING